MPVARAPQAGAVVREVPVPSVRHELIGRGGELIVAKVRVVLVDRGRGDQVVLRSVGPVRKGAGVERNLPELEVDVPAFRVRQPRERAENPRFVGVVREELQERGDVIVDLGVRDQANAARVERILAEVEEIRIDLVVLGHADEIEMPLEVDLGPLGGESKSGRARSRARPEDQHQRGDECAAWD